MKADEISGAQALVRTLSGEGVEVIFGYPGGATLPFYDVLEGSGIRHVLTRHEQGAAHMADGYARAGGRTGVCMATSGPGATNLVTGIATAFMDSSPVVALTGQVPREMIGNDAFQEVDISGITIPVTKHNYLLQDPAEIPGAVQEAFYLAGTGRRGPVLVDIPKDVLAGGLDYRKPEAPRMEGYNPTVEGHPRQIGRAADIIAGAERPLILCGGGVAAAGAEGILRELAEKAGIPVVATLMGKNGFPNSHDLYFGLGGYHGTVAANRAIQEADCLIALGTRFGDRTTGPLRRFAPRAKVIHIDVDPAEISKNIPSLLPIVGDLKPTLEALKSGVAPAGSAGWLDGLRAARDEAPMTPDRESLNSALILQELKGLCPDPVLVTDVGRHQIFAAHYFPIDTPRSFITSGGLGTMGFGLPAALGAQLAVPHRKVITISGDGSFLMNCQEIATAAAEKIPMLALVFNDGCLGMITQLQDDFYQGRRTACDLGRHVDFAGLSRSLGGDGCRVDRLDEMRPALEQGLAAEGPFVIDFRLPAQGHAYPMVNGPDLQQQKY